MSEGARAYAVLAIIAAAIGWVVALSSSQFVGPRREYSGVYRVGFEVSYFVEGASEGTEPPFNPNTRGYLDSASLTLPPEKCDRSAAGYSPLRLNRGYQIRFIGRRKPGPSGHLGMSPAEYLVERVIDIRPLDQDC
ncbi:hypothetical protein [Erythrobacter sp. CCH5-A1]|uniref:hypothetical protein n=1 Tax=Erythrobacter sp. CCH5-A1 TaxID=1768792 RepID=UPI00082F61F6|nr:hypothetical protein [Erythrobacter sp. CCH5-A1]